MSELQNTGQISKIIHEGTKTEYAIVYKLQTGKPEDRSEITIRADTIEDFALKLEKVQEITNASTSD